MSERDFCSKHNRLRSECGFYIGHEHGEVPEYLQQPAPKIENSQDSTADKTAMNMETATARIITVLERNLPLLSSAAVAKIAREITMSLSQK